MPILSIIGTSVRLSNILLVPAVDTLSTQNMELVTSLTLDKFSLQVEYGNRSIIMNTNRDHKTRMILYERAAKPWSNSALLKLCREQEQVNQIKR
jgi:hypothetical protein